MKKKRFTFFLKLEFKIKEILFSLFIFIYYLINFLRKWQWLLPNNKIKIPIILVHGYLHNQAVWFFHGSLLKKKGYGPIYTASLGWPFLSIEAYAKKLQKKIEKIKRKNKIDKVVLIGHSMGGLVSLYYSLNLAPKNFVEAVITIASPIKGTELAILGLGKCAKEMREDSTFIKNLNEKNEKRDFYLFNIATKIDRLVHPYTSSIVEKDPKKLLILDDLGHNTVLFSKKINDKISDWIENYLL